ncbi:MAG: MoaD/ThiS family protein [Vulcanimicrobiaceae bacterium]
MHVRLVAFARLRELLGESLGSVQVAPDACIEDLWNDLARRVPAIVELMPSTRVAVNGSLADWSARPAEGDEIALLPPVGGG